MSNLTKFTPKREDLLGPFEEYFNSFFDNFFSNKSLTSIKSRVNYPKIDIFQNKNTWNIEVAIPGVKAEDLNIEIIPNNNTKLLKISGKISEEYKYNDEYEFHYKELRRSNFERIITLPNFINDEPKATIKNGILKLMWEIKSESPQENIKKIQIKND